MEVILQENAIILAASEKMVSLGSEISQNSIEGKDSKEKDAQWTKILTLLTAYRRKAAMDEKQLEAILFCLRDLSEASVFPTVDPIVGRNIDYVVEIEQVPEPGGVESVSGPIVDNTDPLNPTVEIITDSTLLGVGSVADPLRVAPAAESGTYFTGEALFGFVGGLEIEVIWPIHYINGTQYAAGTDTETLDAADATYDRFDAIIMTSAGLEKITGTPGATPEQPFVDPTTQLLVTYVLVEANEVDLTSDDVVVYDEGTETTVTSNNGTVDPLSTSGPLTGTYNLESGSFNNTHYIDLTFTTPQLRTAFDQMRLFLWLKATFSAGGTPTYLRFTFYNGVSAVSNTVNLTTGNYNFVRTIVGSWQTIIMPLSAFTFTNNTFTRIRITFNGSNATGFKLDNWTLQVGTVSYSPLQNTLTTIATDSGNANADQPSDTFSILGLEGTVVTASGKIIYIKALPLITASGTDTYTGTIPTTLAIKHAFRVEIPNNNTGAATFNGIPIKKNVIDALAANDLKANGVYIFHYDGTNFQVIGLGGSSGGGTWGSITGTLSAQTDLQAALDAKEPTITTLPISKGGTNSGAALNNNRIAVSSGGAIVEAAAITASKMLKSNANGIPVASAYAEDDLVVLTTTQTLTNKRITKRTGTATSSATPTINTDNIDYYSLTAQSVDITSFTTNLSGTPTEMQQLWISIAGTAARAITWGASFESGAATLPTTTVGTTRLDILFVWTGSIWRCMAQG